MSVKITAAAASVLAAGVLGIAGAGAAAAATTGSGSSSAQSTSSAQSGAQDGWKGHRHGTPVTGTALAQVKQAIAAKYPGVTVERAFKTPKGSYIVMGAKGSVREHFRVSADFKTVTEHAGGRHGEHRGGRGHGTPVSGSALTQVTQAVDAKYPGVTVERAFKTPKGSYIVMGAKGSAHERFRVSADLTTVTERTGGHRAGAQ